MSPENLSEHAPRSPYVMLDGIMFVARTIDKARALVTGGNAGDYTLLGISTRMFEHFAISETAFIDVVAGAATDGDVMAWLHANVEAERLATWNSVLLDRRVGDHNRERMALRYPVFAADPSLTLIIDILVADDRQAFAAPAGL